MSEQEPAWEQIISDLGLNPGIEVDSDQRAELLQRWHRERGSRYGKEPDVKGDLEGR